MTSLSHVASMEVTRQSSTTQDEAGAGLGGGGALVGTAGRLGSDGTAELSAHGGLANTAAPGTSDLFCGSSGSQSEGPKRKKREMLQPHSWSGLGGPG